MYTTHCQKCHVLETKLTQKNIEFTECDDMKKMKELGIMQAPMLFLDGKLMNYLDAVHYVNSIKLTERT